MKSVKRKIKTEGAAAKPAKTDTKPRLNWLKKLVMVFVILFFVFIFAVFMLAEAFPEITQLSYPRKIIAQLLQPVQTYFSAGTGWLADYVRDAKLRSNLEYEYQQLYEAYDELLNEAMLVNELRAELSEYEDLMNEMNIHSQFYGVPARVISNDSSSYFSTFTINVGTDNGVQNYMAVVKSGGLVGYTYDVTRNTAKVQTVISSTSSISSLIESTRYQGSVKGTLGIDGRPMCRMYYLSTDHIPRQGDTVVTSGVGMEFPKGIPIGTVRESTRGLDAGKAYVVVEPIVDFERIEYVTVYRYQPSYAEQAEERDDKIVTSSYKLPTVRPVPTFADGSTDTFHVENTPTPAPGRENLSYDDIPGTPTPVPTPTPTPSPTPAPTFSVQDVTIEEDD